MAILLEELLQDKSSIDPSTIPTIEPKFFMEDGKMVGLLPGDEGYEITDCGSGKGC